MTKQGRRPATGSEPPFAVGFREDAAQLAPEIAAALSRAMASADERITLPTGADAALTGLDVPLPESGAGTFPTLARLRALVDAAGANTNGPKCFHFVIGGTTPAALGADLLATIHDTVTYTWVTSPVGVTLELQSLAGSRSSSGCRARGPASWSPAPAWRTSWRSPPRANGGPSATASTSRSAGSRGSRRCRC